jgi:hypothetical protein
VKDLPTARTVLDLLDAFLDETAPETQGQVLEDHFWIEKIEPGKLWLKPLTTSESVIGPVPVTKRVTQLILPMWDIGGVVTKAAQGWRLVEVWSVTP